LRTDIERKNDELEKLRALYDAVNVQHKSLIAERDREKNRLARKHFRKSSNSFHFAFSYE